MALQKYTFSIANDTASGVVYPYGLQEEIQGSSILVAVDRVDTAGDVLDVWFKDVLIAADQTTLNGLVATHQGEINSEALNLAIKGVHFTATLNADKDHDVSFPEYRELSGAMGEVSGHTPGDYIEMFIVHPQAGIVGQYGETVYVKPSGKIDWIKSEGKRVALPTGMILRVRYHSEGLAGPPPEVFVDYRTHK